METSIVLTVIMPCHQEGESIKVVMNTLQSALIDIPHEVLAVYDDPADAQLVILKSLQENYPQLYLLNNEGTGAAKAIYTGLAKAHGRYIVFLVADDVGPVPLLKGMIDLMDRGYDLVATTRYALGGKSFGGSHVSRFFSRGANRLFRLLTRSELTDVTCGFKMFRREMLKIIQLKSQAGWTIAFELTVKAKYNDFKMGEVPIVSYNRMDGSLSRSRLISQVRMYAGIFCWGVFKLWGKIFRG